MQRYGRILCQPIKPMLYISLPTESLNLKYSIVCTHTHLSSLQIYLAKHTSHIREIWFTGENICSILNYSVYDDKNHIGISTPSLSVEFSFVTNN